MNKQFKYAILRTQNSLFYELRLLISFTIKNFQLAPKRVCVFVHIGNFPIIPYKCFAK